MLKLFQTIPVKQANKAAQEGTNVKHFGSGSIASHLTEILILVDIMVFILMGTATYISPS